MDIIQFIYFVIALLITLSVHEAAHALVAYYLGDPTAKMRGRLTLNPIKHLDLFGSIIFLITQRIGWGKPVPVNPANFKHPVRDSALTALAGPMSNFILSFAVALPWKYLGGYLAGNAVGAQLLIILQLTFHVSIYLGIFNLFPFPPLDGSKILGLFVPKRWHSQYANYLANGLPYFVFILMLDIILLPRIFGFSAFLHVIRYLHDLVSMLLLIGT
jgi:Zn-dependent protease